MADTGLLGPGTAVIAFGLASAIFWGAGDFGGGLVTRRTALFGVVLGSQLVGMVLALGVAVMRAEPAPGPMDAVWSVSAGIVGAVGICALYQGLAVGRMGVVAPVTGVVAAAIPVGVGIVTEGIPATAVLVGICLAAVAVVFVSRARDENGRRSGIEFGLLAGLGIGLFNVTIAQVTEGLAFGPLTILRGAEALTIVAFVAASRGTWRVERRLWPAVGVIGVLDMAGNGAYILATQSGPLAIAAVLSSLYPVTTVLLAAIFLRERMDRVHGIGVVAAAAAIVLISVGSRT